MIQTRSLKGKALLSILAATLTAGPVLPAFAQPRPVAAAARAMKGGIDALDDDKVADDLASRGMDSLLQFYFQKNNVPAEKQQEKMVLIALRSINEPSFNTLPAADRKKKIDDIVIGIEKMLPQIKDPRTLLKYASALIVNGTQRLVNTLEYWGDNPKSQAALNPVAEAVDKILAQAADAAKTQGDVILNSIKSPDDPRIRQWEDIDGLRNLAVYTRALSAYGLALSYDKAAAAKRDKVCAQGIAGLTEFATPDSNVRISAEVGIAKLHMANGKYAEAHRHFNIVIKAPMTDDPKYPNKNAGEQYQAQYFDLVTDVLAQQPELAEKRFPALLDWQREKLPADFQKGAEAAASMLEYRIQSGKADLATDKAVKDKANAASVAILMDLVTKRPDLRNIIFEQVMSKLPPKPVMAQLNPLLLEAIVTRGIQAIHHKPAEKEDAHNIDLASDAAREIVKRKGQPGIGPEQVDSSAFRVGVFEERLSAEPTLAIQSVQNKLDAVEAYLTYVGSFGGNKTWAEDALDNALSLIFPLYKQNPNDPRASQLYDMALDTALAKGRQEAAWPYAIRLKELQKFEKARTIFAKVKGTTPSINVMAKYYQMYCDQQLLSGVDKSATVDPALLTQEIQTLADQTNALIDQSLPKVDANQQAKFKLVQVRTTLVAADAARANKNPQRVVDLLKDFEQKISSMPAEQQNDLLGGALFLRVNGLIALSRNEEAIKAIDSLVARQSPAESLRTVSALLTKLNDSYLQEKGKTKPDMDSLRLLAAQRAQLSELLLKQVQKDAANPNKSQYLAFNADAQMAAAELATSAVDKNRFLDSATTTYEELLKAQSDEGAASGLQRKLAIAEYIRGDAANLKKAHDTLNKLFAEKKFGTPFIRASDGDEAQPNEIFWEGLHKLLSAKVKLSKLNNDDAMLEEAKRVLKNFYIQFGDNMGGKGSVNDFAKLRIEILGDWKPDATLTMTTQPSPTTASAPGAPAGR